MAMNREVSTWRARLGLGLSALAALFFAADAVGKLLQVGPVMTSMSALQWPPSAVLPLGVLLAIGTGLYVVPRTSVLGALFLTAYLGGAVATHYRIGSPFVTHVLFGVYVGIVMWAGLALRSNALASLLSGRSPAASPCPGSRRPRSA